MFKCENDTGPRMFEMGASNHKFLSLTRIQEVIEGTLILKTVGNVHLGRQNIEIRDSFKN